PPLYANSTHKPPLPDALPIFTLTSPAQRPSFIFNQHFRPSPHLLASWLPDYRLVGRRAICLSVKKEGLTSTPPGRIPARAREPVRRISGHSADRAPF